MKQPQYLRAKRRKANCCCPAKGQILAISLGEWIVLPDFVLAKVAVTEPTA